MVQINDEGLTIIKTFEGYRSKPYLDRMARPSVWTVGYGTTRGWDGGPVNPDQFEISEVEAENFLRRDVRSTEIFVARLIEVPLTLNQFSSLVSFTYNVGAGSLQRSTLRMKLNRSQYIEAADELPKWRLAGGRVWRGLVRRRAAERELFLAED